MRHILLVLFFFGLSSVAHSAGGVTTEPVIGSCQDGKVWDTKKKACVVLERESQLDDDNLYMVARDLVHQERYEEALTTLSFAKNSDDPRILNYLGFATRKLGRPEESLIYYEAALSVDPDYVLAREYMGEAFLQLGRIDDAREQLSEIERICGRDCAEYKLLLGEIQKLTN